MDDFNENMLNRSERHATYVNFPRPDDCSYLHQLDVEEQCSFVKSTEACAESRFYFNYIQFLYCTFGSDQEYLFALGFLLLMCVCIYYFIILGTTADQFFCPTLAVMAKTLNISESLAGITILAFGNGSPDLFTAVANPDADTELMFAELLGSAAFVIGVIGGMILLIQPFSLPAWGISRDLAFFIGALLWIMYTAADGRFSLIESGVLIGIYIIFLVLVVWEFVRARREVESMRSRISLQGRIPEHDASFRRALHVAGLSNQPAQMPTGPEDLYLEGIRIPNTGLFTDFLSHVNPIDGNAWTEAGWFMRMFTIIKAPFLLVLLLLIPIVDTTVERDGWCKLLNIVHCMTLPLTMVWVNGYASNMFARISVAGWTATLGMSLMVIVFCTSRTDRCPPYHKLFTVLSFLGCIQIIYLVAQEVVSVLETLGIVMKLSKSILGLSLLAWGNSVGDLFANVALARQGYAKMAFAACFGGPLLNLCLGLSFTLIAKALKDPNWIAQVRKGVMGKNCEAYLLQILATTWLGLLFTNFQARRSIGISMILTYVVFLAFSFLGEFDLIHPYGTDHHPDPNWSSGTNTVAG